MAPIVPPPNLREKNSICCEVLLWALLYLIPFPCPSDVTVVFSFPLLLKKYLVYLFP